MFHSQYRGTFFAMTVRLSRVRAIAIHLAATFRNAAGASFST